MYDYTLNSKVPTAFPLTLATISLQNSEDSDGFGPEFKCYCDFLSDWK